MFEVNELVSFFSIDEQFEHLNINLIDEFIDNCSWYKVVEDSEKEDRWMTVANDSGRTIPVHSEEYQIHTKESLRKVLNYLKVTREANKKYGDVCNKIIQLYRKHNRTDSHFKFQGV